MTESTGLRLCRRRQRPVPRNSPFGPAALLPPDEAARYLDITMEELDAEIKAGRLEHVWLTRACHRIVVTSVLDYERRRRSGEFRAEPAEPLDSGIYFVQAGNRGAIKIGYSTGISGRIRDLQVASPMLLRLLNVRAGTVQMEHSLQVKLAKYRVHGEWFRPVAQVLEEVYRS